MSSFGDSPTHVVYPPCVGYSGCMETISCGSCGYPLRPCADGYAIDLAHDAYDRLRPEMYGVPRLDGVIYCPPDPRALKHAGHRPA